MKSLREGKVLTKLQRAERLRELGFNVPSYVAINSTADIRYFREKREEDRFSIRTQPKSKWITKEVMRLEGKALIEAAKELGILIEDTVPPHAYNVTRDQAICICGMLSGSPFTALVCDAIDYQNSAWAGAAIRQDNKITVELAKGPCMVRKVTHDGIVDLRVVYNMADQCTAIPSDEEWPGLATALYELRNLPNNMIAELSWYKVPVGYKRENLLFWDAYYEKEGVESW